MSIAFLLPNDGSVEDIFSYTISINELEQLTNIDFFHTLNNEIESELEKRNEIDIRFIDYSGEETFGLIKEKKLKTDNISTTCLGITKSGLHCKNRTKNKSGYCHLHKAKN